MQGTKLADLELDWTPQLGVGIDSLDRDHKALIGAYNDLIRILCRDGRRRAFLPPFQEFLECAEHHFIHEELVMRNISYVGYRAHKATHDRLRADARDFVVNVEGAYSRSDLSVVTKYFRYWLVNHIVIQDKQIGAFVERGWETPTLAHRQSERESLGDQQAGRLFC